MSLKNDRAILITQLQAALKNFDQAAEMLTYSVTIKMIDGINDSHHTIEFDPYKLGKTKVNQ